MHMPDAPCQHVISPAPSPPLLPSSASTCATRDLLLKPCSMQWPAKPAVGEVCKWEHGLLMTPNAGAAWKLGEWLQAIAGVRSKRLFNLVFLTLGPWIEPRLGPVASDLLPLRPPLRAPALP